VGLVLLLIAIAHRLLGERSRLALSGSVSRCRSRRRSVGCRVRSPRRSTCRSAWPSSPARLR
jgi:hypothetical protein